jgi:hypothetical protein
VRKTVTEKDVADWIIQSGTESTQSGSWVVEFDEIAKHFDLTDDNVRRKMTDIAEWLEVDDRVAAVELNDSDIDMVFCLAYCESLDQDVFMEMFPYLDPDLAHDLEYCQIKLVDEMLDYLYDCEYPDGQNRNEQKGVYLDEIKSYGIPLEETVKSNEKFAEFVGNAMREISYRRGLSMPQMKELIAEGAFPSLREVYELLGAKVRNETSLLEIGEDETEDLGISVLQQ